MSSTEQTVQVYQLRIWIREISPQIWRRLLVHSDSTIAQLHDTLQIAFGWTDEHLHQFFGSSHAMRNELPLSGKVALEGPSWHACLL